MDYPASPRFQKTRTSPPSGYTSTPRPTPLYSTYSAIATVPEIPAIRYFTPIAESSKEYDSPYAKGEDLPHGRLTPSSPRHRSRSTGITPFTSLTSQVSTSQPVSTMSTYSSSSRGSSSYSAPGPRQQQVAASMASSWRTASQSISAVSHISCALSLCDFIMNCQDFTIEEVYLLA